MRIHAIQTGNVFVKTAFLGSPATSGGTLPYFAGVFIDHTTVKIPVLAWAIEHPEGVIVVDTGSNAVIKKNFVTQSRFEVLPDEEIGAQLLRLGITAKDVSKVVLTHLHGDHVDGLKDFQAAPIWVGQREYGPFQPVGGSFFTKKIIPLPEWLHPELIAFRPDRVGPFESSFPLTRDGNVIAVPTPGHTAGHLSVIVMADDVHYFIAGDVSYDQASMISQTLKGPSLEVALHRQTLRHVQAYAQQFPTVYLPSHDPESAHRLALKQIVPQPVTETVAAARLQVA